MSMSTLGLREAILDLHSDHSPLATHNHNQNRQPVDGIWDTQGIQIAYGGYSAFGDACPSDHRALWIDIMYSVMFGQTPDTMWLPTARKLNTRDPRLVQLYNSRVKQEIIKSGFTKRFADFSACHASGEWSNTMPFTYNELQQENTSICQQVEAGPQIKNGRCPPGLQNFKCIAMRLSFGE
jgi:hypothetical protein